METWFVALILIAASALGTALIGYAMLRGHQEQWPVALQQVREGIECLREAGWPPELLPNWENSTIELFATLLITTAWEPLPCPMTSPTRNP